MLKAAIEKIAELSGIKTFTDGNNLYADGDYKVVRPELDLPGILGLNSLDALVKLVRREAVIVEKDTPIFVTVPTYNRVDCFTGIKTDLRNERICLYRAHATDVPGWDSETKLPFEQASIALRTRFQETVDREYTLRLCSQISSGGHVTYNDNGIATSVVTKKGVALQGTETIKPLVTLKPYRTFQEVDQPEGMFLIRIDERGISFIEADGGMWKLAARKIVKEFLEKELAELIEDGRVVVTL